MAAERDSSKGLVVSSRGVVRGSSTRRYMPLGAKSLACRQGPERGSGELRLRRRIGKPCSKNLDEARGSPDVGSDASSRFLDHKLACVAWLADGQYMPVLAGTRGIQEKRENCRESGTTDSVRRERPRTHLAGPAEFNRQNGETTKRTLTAGRAGNSAPAHPSSLKTDRIGGPMEVRAGT